MITDYLQRNRDSIFRLASDRLLFSLASILTPWTLRFQVVIGYLGGVINLILFLVSGIS